MTNNTGAWAGLGGMGAGAGIGALLAAPTGGLSVPMGALLGSGVGMAGGGLLGSIFGGSDNRAPDISGELAKIGALFEQMKAAGRSGINQEAMQSRQLQSSNLASRGTYRSPVAQNVYNTLESNRLRAISSMEGNMAGQEATTRAGLLEKLLGYNLASQDRENKRSAAIGAGFTSLGSSLLGAYLQRLNSQSAAGAGMNDSGWRKQALISQNPNSVYGGPVYGPGF